MGKRTGFLHLRQPEQPPPEGDPSSTGAVLGKRWAARAGGAVGTRPGGGRAAGGTAGPRDRRGWGHGRAAGDTGAGGRTARQVRGGGSSSSARSLQLARQSPSPGADRGSLSHTAISGTAHSPCPAHAGTRGFEHTELQETFPCSFPRPQTSREWGKHTGKTYPHSVSSLPWLCLKTPSCFSTNSDTFSRGVFL